MTVYIIIDNTVTARSVVPEKLSKGALLLETIDQLISSSVTMAQMVTVWNALPGVSPITRFKDRTTAVQRLWAAFEQLPVDPVPARAPRAGSKQDKVIGLLKRPQGATVEEMAVAMGWQHHTVRGMISGALKKKLGLSVISEKTDRGRLYRIEREGEPAL